MEVSKTSDRTVQIKYTSQRDREHPAEKDLIQTDAADPGKQGILRVPVHSLQTDSSDQRG